MMEQRKVLTVGTQVRLTQVDRYGFWGREAHPQPSDEGFLGFVTRVLEVYDAERGDPFNVPQDTVGMPLRDEDWVVYEVTSPDGRVLQLVDHEIEVLRG